MQIVNIIILPYIIFVFSMILQNWLDQDEFNQFYKFYGFGIILGIILVTIFSFINPVFIRSAHHVTIGLKSLLLNGLLFSFILTLAIYFVINKLSGSDFTNSWSIGTILSVGFVIGVFSVIFIVDSFTEKYPSNINIYPSYLSLFLTLSLILSFGITHYIEEFNLIRKILWALGTVIINAILFGAFHYLVFYSYIWHLLFIVVFIGFYIFFEISDFRIFRQSR